MRFGLGLLYGAAVWDGVEARIQGKASVGRSSGSMHAQPSGVAADDWPHRLREECAQAFRSCPAVVRGRRRQFSAR